jgi:phosphoglycolate phosphatase-like HAD superfamily hydrolase
MSDWMTCLARHYEAMRRRYPEDRLMIVFDIDGTILDMRYPILHQLREYDRFHGTAWFSELRPTDVETHETRIDEFLRRLQVDDALRASVLAFFEQRFWSLEALLEGHRPYRGVLEVIRWFQIQPGTFVGLNTGRPEHLRQDTIRSLNELGAEWKVRFEDDRLVMKEGGPEQDIGAAKVEGLRRLQGAGYRIFAFIDNEPGNLAAAFAFDRDGEILLLHADTIFDSKRQALPKTAVSGRDYDLTSLIGEREIPAHVELVWHGVNKATDLRQFLASKVSWAEVDVRRDPVSREPVLQHEPFNEEAYPGSSRPLSLETVLELLSKRKRSLKLDLKENGGLIETTLGLLDKYGFDDSRLWFNGEVHTLGEKGFRTLRERYPDAVVQCPLDALAPLLIALPDRVQGLLATLRAWGINRFSVAWGTPRLSRVVDLLDRWSYDVNIYEVPDLESFLRAALLLPRSITSNFDFPKWGYRGGRPDGTGAS